jgi:hypothetical protein
MNINKYMFLLIVIMACPSCSHLESYIDIAKQKDLSRGYFETLDTWTRSQIVYSEFETRVHIRATYQGAVFKKAYLDEYARIYHLTDAEKKIREEAQVSIASDFSEFFFYAYIPDKDSNDFGKERSIWTIYLLNGSGNRIKPVEIRRIDQVTPLITSFYPYVNPAYGMCYHLKFPPLSKEKPFKLVFTSVIGKVELNWK